MPNPVTLVLADDHQIVLDGLVDIFEAHPDFRVLATANSGRAAISRVQEHQPDMLLIDLNMPDQDGLEVLRVVKASFPRVKVLILTMYDSPALQQRVLAAGADAYLLKAQGRRQLLQAVEAVLAGRVFAGELSASPKAPQTEFTDNFSGKIALSERETEVLRLIARSMSNEEIAAQLFISVFTVKAHRRNLKRKLHLERTADLVKFAIQHGIV